MEEKGALSRLNHMWRLQEALLYVFIQGIGFLYSTKTSLVRHDPFRDLQESFSSTGLSVGRRSEEMEKFSLIPVPQQKSVKAETIFIHPLSPVDSSKGRLQEEGTVVAGHDKDTVPLALL